MRLDEFLAGRDLAEFFSESWGATTCHFSKCAFSLERPESLLATLLAIPHLRYPQVRVFDGNGALNPLSYTASNRYKLSEAVSIEKVAELATAPHTIKFENLAAVMPVFAEWSATLQRLFSSRITLNGYFSFGPGGGIPPHYDSHHIFVIQLLGEKIWRIGDVQSEQFPYGLLGMPENCNFPTTTEMILRSGEMLYLPPGRFHSVQTERISFHVTVGIHTRRCVDGLLALVKNAACRHHELRDDMPFSVSADGLSFRSLNEAELSIALQILRTEQKFSEYLKDE